MKNLNVKAACGILAAALVAPTLTGCGASLDGTDIVATVDGEDVTLGLASYVARDMQAQTVSMYQQYMGLYSTDGSTELPSIWDGENDDGISYGEDLKNEAMDYIKQLYVVRAHADEYDVALTDEEETAIQEAADAFMAANDEETLEKLLVSEDDIITYLELRTYLQKMQDPMVADVDQEVSEDEKNQSEITYVQFSTAGTETDDDGNTIDLTDDEIAAVKEEAEEFLDRLNEEPDSAEADFDTVLAEVDESLSSTSVNFTTADPDSSTVDSEVLSIALTLEDGEIYDEVIEGEDGNYYVLRLDEMYDEEATDSKAEEIIDDREDEAYTALVDEWEEAADMDIKDSIWKKFTITDSVQFTYVSEDTEETDAADTTSEDDTYGYETDEIPDEDSVLTEDEAADTTDEGAEETESGDSASEDTDSEQ